METVLLFRYLLVVEREIFPVLLAYCPVVAGIQRSLVYDYRQQFVSYALCWLKYLGVLHYLIVLHLLTVVLFEPFELDQQYLGVLLYSQLFEG